MLFVALWFGAAWLVWRGTGWARAALTVFALLRVWGWITSDAVQRIPLSISIALIVVAVVALSRGAAQIWQRQRERARFEQRVAARVRA